MIVNNTTPCNTPHLRLPHTHTHTSRRGTNEHRCRNSRYQTLIITMLFWFNWFFFSASNLALRRCHSVHLSVQQHAPEWVDQGWITNSCVYVDPNILIRSWAGLTLIICSVGDYLCLIQMSTLNLIVSLRSPHVISCDVASRRDRKHEGRFLKMIWLLSRKRFNKVTRKKPSRLNASQRTEPPCTCQKKVIFW